MRLALLTPLLVVFCNLTHAAEFGDKRDKPGEVQKLVVPLESIPPSTQRSADEEFKSFQIAPGFKVELIASDPLVQDPVVTQIAPDGRLWVVEMRGFMASMDGKGEELPVGRVVILEDTDGDGRMDKSTVFQDGLVMPRALMLVGDGALIGAPPKLWYCRDIDGDGKADEKTEIAGDFGWVNNPLHPELGNPEQAANSLLWAFDNWIYAAHYTHKFRFEGGKFSAGVTTFRGQWGLAQDNDGHLFYNSNQDPLRVDILPSHYTGRNPNYEPCAGTNVQVYTDQLVWPIRVNPGVNRGYREGILRENGHLKEFTAACSPHIYRSGAFGDEFEGNAFICEPAGNLIKRELMTSAKGTLTAKEAYKGRDFLASNDERFRPVNLTTGPDGALYVTDFYRGVLQHRESFTTYLRTYSEERGLDKPLHLGRIWRVAPEGLKHYGKLYLKKESSEQLMQHLESPVSWLRETSQRLLVERNDLSVVAQLKHSVEVAKDMGGVHALWTLDGLHKLDEQTVTRAIASRWPRVRAAAIRLCEGFFKTDAHQRVLAKLLSINEEHEPFVQQQLVLTLGEAADKEADLKMASLIKQAPETEFLLDAALCGLAGRELALLEVIANEASNDDKLIASLTRCIVTSRKTDHIEKLLKLMVTSTRSKAMLDGALSVSMKRPLKLPNEPVELKQIKDTRAAKLAAMIVWPGKPGVKPEPPLKPLSEDQQARYELGKALFTGVCAACHQPHGKGLDGLAPPLVDSEWVLGSEQRIVRIVLHGLTGPISVKGKSYRLDMPAFGAFTDEQIASVLTYIRREWEHTAAPVEPETVKTIRAETANRREAWVQDQLRAIP